MRKSLFQQESKIRKENSWSCQPVFQNGKDRQQRPLILPFVGTSGDVLERLLDVNIQLVLLEIETLLLEGLLALGLFASFQRISL